ncbi:MAG: DNA/RNA non-specific endonuclease [Slackia sp.]|nr:DNA/RNA non-specific endonuclease [Slackia sp.]
MRFPFDFATSTVRQEMPSSKTPLAKKGLAALFSFVLACALSLPLTACDGAGTQAAEAPSGEAAASIDELPAYDGELSVEVNDGQPGFTAQESAPEAADDPFEKYSPLDDLGRCETAFALVGPETLPDKPRGDISNVHPSGWKQARYDTIDQEALYNRSHLIAHQLAGEDANERNLITGTRTMNVEGMLPYEELVGDYVRETGNHVLYRVTPVFEGDELVARGVQMEGLSVEDSGRAVCFNVFVYNIEPGIEIDYATGDSHPSDAVPEVSSNDAINEGSEGKKTSDRQSSATRNAQREEGAKTDSADASTEANYILNTNSKKFHDPSCPSADDISARNKREYTGTRDALIDEGYEPCGRCNP